jgi:hypothetical protein
LRNPLRFAKETRRQDDVAALSLNRLQHRDGVDGAVLSVRIEGDDTVGPLCHGVVYSCLKGRSLTEIDGMTADVSTSLRRYSTGVVVRAVVYHDDILKVRERIVQGARNDLTLVVRRNYQPITGAAAHR